EAAFVGTFHGFCARLLRAHPLPAGLDPDFAILDEGRAGGLREQALDDALVELLAGAGDEAVDLLAAYGTDPVRAMIKQVYAELRSPGGLPPPLPLPVPGADADNDERDAIAALALLDGLLGSYGRCYASLKQQRAAVDFDDLELLAGELLTGHAELRAAWSD